MKLAKSLLLSSAVGLTAVASAQAADLPFRKAAPVEYVRVCDFTGAGYFYIPGTDTCLKIGGYVRTEYAYISPSAAFFPSVGTVGPGGAIAPGGTRFNANQRDVSGFFARGRIEADARTQTAYGTLRTFVRYEITRTGGNYAGQASTQQGFTSQGNNGAGNANVDKAFIQFAGFTAGRAQSFFDDYADTYNFEGIANSDYSTQVFAYTATFGGGFSATIAAEDPTVRRNGIGNSEFLDPASGGLVTSNLGYGAVRLPDFVGVVRLDQAWGHVQLSAAYHEVALLNTGVAGANGFVPTQAINRDGFAVQGSVNFKLPMLAAGDDIWLQGAYQQGAYLYQDSSTGLNNGFNALLVGGFQHIDHDAYVYGNANGTTTVSLSEGFSVMGAFHHYFTPNFSDVLFGSYEEVSYGNRARNTDWRLGGIGDGSTYRIGNQFIWTPVNNLSVGIEAIYAHIDQDIAGTSGNSAQAVASRAAFRALRVQQNPDAFEGRIRVERDF